ncbi:MAG: glycosyltransferase [Desulfuromonadales bacterium]|nr:MAG: glycosyltransferase [Desulfuromonadales bacterium]
MNIVQVIPSFNVGGGELLAVRLCAEIKKQKPDYTVTLVSLYDPIPTIVYDEALSSGARIVTLGKKKGFDPYTPLRVFKALRAIKPDVIHTHLAGLRYTLLAATLCSNSQKIHTVHNMASHETFGFLKHVHRFAFRYLSWTPIALSREVQDSIRDVHGLKAPIVNNGIGLNSRILNRNRDDIRKELQLPLDHHIIISIGRLCIQKNQALLIDAFYDLSKEDEKFTLLIVGDDTSGGSYKKMLEEKVLALPEAVSRNVHFLGPRKDIPELLAASDIFVLSSDWEGVPLTLLEAMGYGTPAVCTSVGGIPDVIDHGVNGILVPKGDSIGLAKVLNEISVNKSYSSVLALNALEKFKKLYSIEKTAQGYLTIYTSPENRI